MGKKKTRQNGDNNLNVVLKKGISTGEQLFYVAGVIKSACPHLFKKTDPYPTVRMVKFGKGEITYEITAGKSSKAKVGFV